MPRAGRSPPWARGCGRNLGASLPPTRTPGGAAAPRARSRQRPGLPGGAPRLTGSVPGCAPARAAGRAPGEGAPTAPPPTSKPALRAWGVDTSPLGGHTSPTGRRGAANSAIGVGPWRRRPGPTPPSIHAGCRDRALRMRHHLEASALHTGRGRSSGGRTRTGATAPYGRPPPAPSACARATDSGLPPLPIQGASHIPAMPCRPEGCHAECNPLATGRLPASPRTAHWPPPVA